MQTFKEIPYQNYIELKFNTKNLNEAQKHQALIKYKRNSQLLAQLFTFRQPTQQPQSASTDPIITEQTLAQLRQQIQNEKAEAAKKIDQIKNNSQHYEEAIKSISSIKTKQELSAKVQHLKKMNLYDSRHPFFVENSPFYLNSTDQEILEVTSSQIDMLEEQDWQKINLFQLP